MGNVLLFVATLAAVITAIPVCVSGFEWATHRERRSGIDRRVKQVEFYGWDRRRGGDRRRLIAA